jgi:uncharacterized membrane protein required for colicin V production
MRREFWRWKGDDIMNILDLLVIAIMGLCIAGGAMRGFVRTVLGLVNFVLSIFLTNLLYPHVGKFLRGFDGLYDSLSTSISRILGLEALIETQANATAADIVSALSLPDAIKETLIANNNPIIHNALGVSGIADYISGFLAGIVINVISMIAVFVLVFIGLTFLARLLHIVAKLPILNSLNKLLGGTIGAIWGLLLTWFILAVVVLYFSANTTTDVAHLLETSAIAKPLHESNFMLNSLLRIFP